MNTPKDSADRRRRIVTWAVLGCVLMGLLVTCILVLPPSSPPAAAKAPTGPPPPAQPPPARTNDRLEALLEAEREADALLQHARNAMSMRRWPVALETLDRLEREHGGTPFLDVHQDAIAGMRAEAEARLAAQPPRSSADPPPPPVEDVPNAREQADRFECRLLATLRGHARAVVAVGFSPDGKLLATGSQDGAIKLWDPETGQCRRTLGGHTGFIESVAFTPDGSRLISSSMDSTIRIWDSATGACRRVIATETGPVHAALPLSDSQRIVSGGRDGVVRFWDIDTARCTLSARPAGAALEIQHMDVSADGSTVASCGRGGRLNLWSAEDGTSIRSFTTPSSKLWCTALSRDGKHTAAAGNHNCVRVWDITTGGPVKRLDTPRLNRGLAYSPDGRWLAAGDWAGYLHFWDAATYERVATVRAHPYTAFRIAFSADSTRLASVSFDVMGKVWALKTPAKALHE